MNLNIKPFNTQVNQMYKNHGHFHDGDAGLDIYVINKQTIEYNDEYINKLAKMVCRSIGNKF